MWAPDLYRTVPAQIAAAKYLGLIEVPTNGLSTPDFVHTMRLMAAIPEFAVECRRIAGLMDDCDPELQRDLNQLLERWRHRLARLAQPEESGSEGV